MTEFVVPPIGSPLVETLAKALFLFDKRQDYLDHQWENTPERERMRYRAVIVGVFLSLQAMDQYKA